MKKIKLTQEKTALVDDSDFLKLKKFKWYANKGGKNFYALRNYYLPGKIRKTMRMHALIMGPAPDGFEVDHVDGNGLNNQRKNLRFCTKSQNAMNVGKRLHNTSGFKGVSWDNATKKWKVQININKKQCYLGVYSDKLSAYEVYCKACVKFHGEFGKF
jgi:hypothetical protein